MYGAVMSRVTTYTWPQLTDGRTVGVKQQFTVNTMTVAGPTSHWCWSVHLRVWSSTSQPLFVYSHCGYRRCPDTPKIQTGVPDIPQFCLPRDL